MASKVACNNIASNIIAICISHRPSSYTFCNKISMFHEDVVLPQSAYVELVAKKTVSITNSEMPWRSIVLGKQHN